ncbi:MAG: VOC family protein [Verrucomicrobiae bacterium]|nr:VOC family protein [Verrucomicrobiae bacterium]
MNGIGVKEIAFVGYPVTDLDRARDFYGRVLGLECTLDHPVGIETEQGDAIRWIEYEIGNGAIAISNAWPPSGQSGPGAALEVADLDIAVERLRAEGVTFKTDVMASPSCRFVGIADPDGNDLTIHQHNPAPEN